jgi:hypothetical protein
MANTTLRLIKRVIRKQEGPETLRTLASTFLKSLSITFTCHMLSPKLISVIGYKVKFLKP